jgi:DNA-binding response OmpR family regulator
MATREAPAKSRERNRRQELTVETSVTMVAKPLPEFANDSLTVVVIESYRALAASLSRYFNVAAGFRVKVALDLDTGIEAVRRIRPDVVVCNVECAENAASIVAKACHQMTPRPLLIAVAERSNLGDLLFQAGYDRYLIKPVRHIELETAIRLHRLNQLNATRGG